MINEEQLVLICHEDANSRSNLLPLLWNAVWLDVRKHRQFVFLGSLGLQSKLGVCLRPSELGCVVLQQGAPFRHWIMMMFLLLTKLTLTGIGTCAASVDGINVRRYFCK